MQDLIFGSIDVLEEIAISRLTPTPKGVFKSLKFLGKGELGITINRNIPAGFDYFKEGGME